MKICCFILFVLIAEIFLALGFYAFTPENLRLNKRKFDCFSVLKGVLERVFLGVSLFFTYPHALTLFGTLKLGTRFISSSVSVANESCMSDEREQVERKKEEKRKADNSYFLVGNLISVLLAIVYVAIFKCYICK